jgi:hypothetical protein
MIFSFETIQNEAMKYDPIDGSRQIPLRLPHSFTAYVPHKPQQMFSNRGISAYAVWQLFFQ